MSFLMENLRRGFTYREKKVFLQKLFPLTPLLAFLSIVISTVFLDIRQLIVEFLFLLSLSIASRFVREEYSMLKAILIPTIALTSITYIFYNLESALIVLFRILDISMAFSLMFQSIDFDELASVFNRIPRIGTWFSMIAITSNLIPIVSKEARDTLDALYLRGVLKGFIFKPRNLIVFVTVFLSSVLWRINYLSEALLVKGYGEKKKVSYIENKFGKRDILFLSLVAIYLIVQFMFVKNQLCNIPWGFSLLFGI